ncbi:hypothetical protein C8J57DRAFT_607647, partial [Mycena rebaudengoi]
HPPCPPPRPGRRPPWPKTKSTRRCWTCSAAIELLPKVVRPLDKQFPHERRRLWDSVEMRLIMKEFSYTTREKYRI